LLFHAVSRLRAAAGMTRIVLAVPAGREGAVAAELDGFDVTVVPGGATRQQSVLAALQCLPAEVDVVLVHDAARPLVPVALVEAVAAAVRNGAPAAVPGLPVTDTVKRVDAAGLVIETPPRERLRAIQTPQGFARDVLERAHRLPEEGFAATDDAGLVERLGEPVLVVPGHADAFKITHPDDLVRAEALLQSTRSVP
jgi:2-C-methyl-D-erythritol 4-phosphate cytidylyltransferase